jgi:hypothetical protein
MERRAKIAIIAITTSSSTKVKAERRERRSSLEQLCPSTPAPRSDLMEVFCEEGIMQIKVGRERCHNQ